MGIFNSIEIGSGYQKLRLSVKREGKQYLATAAAAQIIAGKPLIPLINEHLGMGLRAACHIKTKELIFFTENDTVQVPKTIQSLPLDQVSISGLVAKRLEEHRSSLGQFDTMLVLAILAGKNMANDPSGEIDPRFFVEMQKIASTDGFAVTAQQLRDYLDLRISSDRLFRSTRSEVLMCAPKSSRDLLTLAAFRLKEAFRDLENEMRDIYQARAEKKMNRLERLSLSEEDKITVAANVGYLSDCIRSGQLTLLTVMEEGLKDPSVPDARLLVNFDSSGRLLSEWRDSLPCVRLFFRDQKIIKCEFTSPLGGNIPEKLRFIIIRTADDHNRPPKS